MYAPGETLSILKKLLHENQALQIDLSKENCFCFDNEAFRFLACLKNGIQYGDIEKKLFSSSWEIAVEETRRLLHIIKALPPHLTQDTISLNNARRIIIIL